MATKDTKPKEVQVTPEELEQIKKLKREFTILEHNEQEKKRIRNKRDAIFNGILLGLNTVIAIGDILSGAWIGLSVAIINTIWLLLVWVLERQISDQRFIINLQFGLNDLQQTALKEAVKGKK